MKHIAQSLFYLFCLSFNFLEANTEVIKFNNSTQETHQVETSHHCQKVTIWNKGHDPIKDFIPFANEKAYYTLESLAEKIGKETNPVIALYEIWKSSLPQGEPLVKSDASPLDYLNLIGCCSKKESQKQFITLCHALGIDTRQAGLKGKHAYDFCFGEDQWTFLNIKSGRFYLGWDNKTAVSSDQLRDDPMLVLRTKAGRLSASIDLVKACRHFSRFNVINPEFFETDKISTIIAPEKRLGFDLYNNEKLIYTAPEVGQYEVSVDQIVNLAVRSEAGEVVYHSPFPIKTITNQSDEIIYLKKQARTLNPHSTYSVADELLFDLEIESPVDCQGHLIVTSTCSWKMFPTLKKGTNEVYLGTDENESFVEFTYECNQVVDQPTVSVLNHKEQFGFHSPVFVLETNHNSPAEKMHWQISSNDQFKNIPSNLEQEQHFAAEVELSELSLTFLNPDETYYFRVKGYKEGIWSDWSIPFAFSVKKPLSIGLVEFDKIGDKAYEINWEREADVSDDLIEYYVFGSNAFDFIPSIYTSSQINEIMDDQVIDQERNNNLIAVTTDLKIVVDGSLAYYRIVVKQRGEYSVPSPIIHVYDHDLVYPRSILSLEEIDCHQSVVKRVLIPPTYSWTDIALPRLLQKNKRYHNSLLEIEAAFEKGSNPAPVGLRGYVKPPKVSKEIWDQVKPWFLPENHPSKAKIDRIFSRSRVTLTQDTMKKAGFNGRTGRYTRVTAVLHAECMDCFFKVFCDAELHLRMPDWQKWLHRIQGRCLVKDCIEKYNFGKWFTVPDKWIYPLPQFPECPRSNRYLPKNFILVCSNAQLYDHSTNKKLWKKHMSKPVMDALYVTLDECGMWDSVFAFNVPYCKTGKYTWVDTEYYHKWPVNFSKLGKYFSKNDKKYWDHLIKNNGPRWYTRGGEDGRKRK